MGYREHLEENAEFRFRVSLPLRVRYAAATSLVTSVEWSIRHLVNHRSVLVPSRPKNIKLDDTCDETASDCHRC